MSLPRVPKKSPAFRFYPSDFTGSPDVQAMELQEIGAYTLLLCMAWNSERHGYLPNDENLLRRWARMTKEQWTESREMLLKKFPIAEDGMRYNPRMVAEAEKQRLFNNSQSEKGKQGGRPKKKPGLSEIKPGLSKQKPEESQTKAKIKPSVSVSAFVSVSALGGEEVKTQEQKQMPSRVRAARGLDKPPDPRFSEFKSAFFEHCQRVVQADPSWDGRQAKALSEYLAATPGITLPQWRQILENRARSDIPQGEPLTSWIARARIYYKEPLDRFGVPKGIGHGQNQPNSHHGSSAGIDRDAYSREQTRIVAERRYGIVLGGDDGANEGAIPHADPFSGHAGDVPGGVGGDGSAVRGSDVPGRVIEGNPRL